MLFWVIRPCRSESVDFQNSLLHTFLQTDPRDHLDPESRCYEISVLENLSLLDGDTTCLVRIRGPCWQKFMVFECPHLDGRNPLLYRGLYRQLTCLSVNPGARSRFTLWRDSHPRTQRWHWFSYLPGLIGCFFHMLLRTTQMWRRPRTDAFHIFCT